jgi:hypothetical protein
MYLFRYNEYNIEKPGSTTTGCFIATTKIFYTVYEKKEKISAETAERKLQTVVIFAIMNDRIRGKRVRNR